MSAATTTLGSHGAGERARLFHIGQPPANVVLMTAIISYIGVATGALFGWPLWLIAPIALAPWAVVVTSKTIATSRQFGRLALLYVLVITELAHLGEHVAQMVQIHVMHIPAKEAQGVISSLNTEWVHFIFNSWVLIGTVLVLRWARNNPWLWEALLLALWHECEHLVIFLKYLATGIPGDPGLLAAGGRIGHGLPITRPDLHFLYNLAETVPLVVAFIWQASRAVAEQRANASADAGRNGVTDSHGQPQAA